MHTFGSRMHTIGKRTDLKLIARALEVPIEELVREETED